MTFFSFTLLYNDNYRSTHYGWAGASDDTAPETTTVSRMGPVVTGVVAVTGGKMAAGDTCGTVTELTTCDTIGTSLWLTADGDENAET